MKKFLLFLMFALFCIPWAANAQQTVEIGDGTSTSNQVPIGTYYNYSITEMLYTAEEIGTAGTINSISFYYMGLAEKDLPITVYMQNVDAADLSSGISLAEAEEVFSGTLSVTTTAGWVTIELNTPFAYDGSSNLLIGIIKDYLYYFSGQSWQGTSVSNMARYTQSDSGGPYTTGTVPGTAASVRPNIQIDITPGGGPVCEKPETLEVSDITETGATLTWTGGSGTYNAEYKLGSMDWAPLFSDLTETTFTLDDLNPATTYSVRVQSLCEGDATSGWKSVNFTTACGTITTFPWTEDFESYAAGNFVDPCWVNEHVDGSGSSIFRVNTSSQGGNATHQLQLPDMAIGTLTKLVLPEMNVPENYEFSIDIYRSSSTYNDNYPNEGIRVYASTNGEIEGATELAFIPRQFAVSNDVIPAETEAGWYTYELPIGFSGTCYIILRGESQYCTSTYMDNFAVKAMPTCIRPTGLAVTANSVTAHNATITWSENGEADTWIVEYVADADFDLADDSEIMTETAEGEPTYTFTGLDPETTFYVRVKADCGGNGVSEYSNVVHFTTAIACPAPTALAVNPGNYSAEVNWNGTSESYVVSYRTAAYAEGIYEEFNKSGVPTGWTRYSGLVDDVIAGEATLTTVSSYWNTNSNALGQYNMKLNIYGNAIKHWLVTPEFNLTQDLSFDLALTDYGNEDPIENMENQADDRFAVLIYANDAWNILREWNNSGSEYVFNNISTTGENVTIDLSRYYGQNVKIAFYGESTSSTDNNAGDNDLHIDNVFCGTYYESGDWQDIFVEETTATIPDLTPETAYDVHVQGDCGEDGPSLATSDVTFTTLEGCPVPQNMEVTDVTYNSATVSWDGYNDSYNVSYRTAAYVDGVIENFDVSGVPSGWTRYSGLVDNVIAGDATLTTTTSGWNTNSNALGQYNMKINIYGTYAKYWLVTPEFKLSQDLSFDLALTDYNNSDPIEDPTLQADDRFAVLIFADNAWTILREWNNSGSEYVYNSISSEGENVSIDLSAYYGKKVKIAFYGESTNPSDMENTGGDNDLHIDNIMCGVPYEAGEWETIEANESPVVLELEPETDYEVKVQGFCDGVETEWTDVITFTTEEAPAECTTIVLNEENPVWSTDFEAEGAAAYTGDLYTGATPRCWSVPVEYFSASADNIGEGIDTLPQIYHSFNTTPGGHYSLRIHFRSLVAMPELDESVDLGKVRMSMYVRQSYWRYKLQIGIITDMDNPEESFVPVALVNNPDKNKTYFECGFSSVKDLVGAGRYIAFKNIGSSENDPYCVNYLDDIVLTYVPEEACQMPLDYTEDFEDYTNLPGATGYEPECWDVITEDVALESTTKPQIYNAFNTTDNGGYSLRMMNRCVYAMPKFAEDADGQDLTMTLNVRQPNALYRLQVGLVDEAGEFTLVKTIRANADMEEYTVNFTNFNVANRIAFRNTLIPGTGMATDYFDYSYNYLDDILVEATSAKMADMSGEMSEDVNAILDNIEVYPNPTTGDLYIEAVDVQKVECYNQMGQLVRVYDNVLNRIALDNLTEGVYMLRITVPQGVTVRKVVKK